MTSAVIGALRVNLGLDTAEFERGANRVKTGLDGLSSAFAVLGGAAVFTAFTAGLGAAVGRIEETRRLTAQLDRALANTGNTAQTSGAEVSAFADQLERSTGRAAEEVLAVSTNLATFGFNRQVFYDAIELANDMSAAWGGDLRQNIEGVARALADPERGLGMLTKRGITFTDQQKELIAGFIQANDLIGAQGVILDALNEQVQGVAEAGFGGLTRAQANATLALETFFEAIANGLGANSGLEIALGAVTFALDTITNNLGNIGRVATVAGAAILTALGPAVWSVVSGAAAAAFTAMLAGIRAVGVAIAANPIGFLVTALAAAITAAFVFRDEIEQAIGIDVAGIVQGAANLVIGSFDLAFRNIRDIWSSLPDVLGDITISTANAVIGGIETMINGAIGLINDFTRGARGAFSAIGLEIGDVGDVEFGGFENRFAGALGNVGASLTQNLRDVRATDYISELGNAFQRSGEKADSAASSFAGFGDIILPDGGGGGGGGVAGAIGGATTATNGLSASMEQAQRIGEQVTSTLASGFSDFFRGLIRGTTSASDAIGNLLGRLGDLFINQAFQGLFGGLSGGIGNFFSSLFGGVGGGPLRLGFNLPGYANGTNFAPGGLAMVGERGPELVNLPRGSQVIPNHELRSGTQQNNVHITTGVSVDRQGSISSYVESVVQNGIEVFNDALPVRVQQINADPRAR